MAGIVQRQKTWYACFRVGGKLKVRTTGIKVCPSVPPGKSKNAVMRESELQARIIAEELEKEAKGATLNVEVIVSLAGNNAKSVLRNKRYMPSVREHLNKWLSERPSLRSSSRGHRHAAEALPVPHHPGRRRPAWKERLPRHTPAGGSLFHLPRVLPASGAAGNEEAYSWRDRETIPNLLLLSRKIHQENGK